MIPVFLSVFDRKVSGGVQETKRGKPRYGMDIENKIKLL
jgi:hypothetical protein